MLQRRLGGTLVIVIHFNLCMRNPPRVPLGLVARPRHDHRMCHQWTTRLLS